MSVLYVNRARNTSSGIYSFWLTENKADVTMSSSGSPDQTTHHDHVVVGVRTARGQKKIDVSAQITGSNSYFVVPDTYVEDTLSVFYNGQALLAADIITSPTTFSIDFTPPVGTTIVIEYRPA